MPEHRRSIWDLQNVELHDGGPDEDADTLEENSVFATQGVFVP